MAASEAADGMTKRGRGRPEGERQDRRYRSLLAIVELISVHTDLRGLLPDVAACLNEIVEFEGLAFVLASRPDATDVSLMRLTAEGTDMTTSSLPALHETSLGALWGSHTPVFIHDLTSDVRFPEFSRALLEHGLLSACILPLTTAIEPVGILTFACSRQHAYEEAELTFLEAVANQVAVAIANVRHHEEAQAYQRQLEADRDHWRTLLQVNNAVVGNLDLPALLATVRPMLQRMVTHQTASLALLAADSTRLSLYAMDPPLPPELADTMMSFDAESSPLGSRALALRKPMVAGLQDLAALPEPLREHALRRNVTGICFLPLITPRRLLGALTLGSSSPEVFTPDVLDRLFHVGGQIAIAIENALAFGEIARLKDRLTQENVYLEDEISGTRQFEDIVGESRAMQRVLAQVRSVAATDTAVLLLGETGTGKELVARAIHKASPRSARPLVTVNCTTSPAGLLESEWFGHEKGAFTGALGQKVGRFELAHQGTLFLDEVGDVPLDLQAKLLRVLQEHEIERLGSTRTLHVDFRVVAATNRNLEEMVANREYRADLYYRLNVFPIRIPPLRDRPEDIPVLVRTFTQRYAKRMRRSIDSIPRDTMETLCRWSWPGNVRELQNVIERAVILSTGSVLRVPRGEFEAAAATAPAQTLEAAEREHILRTLNETGWLIGGPGGAAVRLGVKRTTLVSTMRRLGIVRPRPTR